MLFPCFSVRDTVNLFEDLVVILVKFREKKEEKSDICNNVY